MSTRYRPPLAAFLFLALALLAVETRAAHSAESPAYLALGDSLAFGVGASNPAAEGYVGLSHFALQESPEYAETGLELINVSAPGATSADLLLADGQIDRALAEIETRQTAPESAGAEVEIITIDIGGNDLLALAEPESPCAVQPGSQACLTTLGQMLNSLQENLTEVLTRLRDAAPDARIFVMDLYNPYSGTGDEREVIASVGVQQVNGVITAVAADPALDVRLVSVFDLFEGRGTQWIASDGIHPNNDGHRVMGETLLAAIENQPVVLPSDLVALPADGAGETADNPSSLTNSSDGDDTLLILLIALPVAFGAGVLLSSAYFVARGRR